MSGVSVIFNQLYLIVLATYYFPDPSGNQCVCLLCRDHGYEDPGVSERNILGIVSEGRAYFRGILANIYSIKRLYGDVQDDICHEIVLIAPAASFQMSLSEHSHD